MLQIFKLDFLFFIDKTKIKLIFALLNQSVQLLLLLRIKIFFVLFGLLDLVLKDNFFFIELRNILLDLIFNLLKCLKLLPFISKPSSFKIHLIEISIVHMLKSFKFHFLFDKNSSCSLFSIDFVL